MNRRTLLKGAGLVAVGAALSPPDEKLAAAPWPGHQTPPERSRATPSGSMLVLLGTQGGPNVTMDRAETASVLVVDGHAYLIDCGYGTLHAFVRAGLHLSELSDLFVTHLHNDHTADVAALLSHMWTASRVEPMTVHGPFGTTAMVAGALTFFKADADIRIVDEGRSVRPESVFQGHDLSAPSPIEAFHDERIRVRAVENAHFPERATARMPYRSLAYRFEMRDRTVVFSGDTAYSRSLVDLARGADLFVCEATDSGMRQRLVEEAQASVASNTESVARHVVEAHVSTEDVGRMATEARVKTVVLSHLLPGSNPLRGPELPDTSYIAGVRRFFSGEVIVGRDQMKL
jgi:ribonuclease BN (tRNA processing enzyme)